MNGLRSALAQFCARLGVTPEVSPGIDSDAPRIDAAGDLRYSIGDELGRGGSGRVLLGVDRNLRRTVALKVLAPGDAQDPTLVQAFLEEAIITGGLEHPNIVPAYDLGYSEQLGLYYGMKRLTGRSLEKVLADLRQGSADALRTYSLFRLLGILVDICRAVTYAHSRGVIHTDLKPANVLIGPQGEVAVVDWGLAKVVGPAGTRQARSRMISGTPAYMSPEQINQAPSGLDFGADVWALGVILYEMLTLQRPFTAPSLEALFQAIERAPLVPPSRRTADRPVPPAIEAICMRALERDRGQRYPTVREMLGDIEDYLEGTRERMRRAEVARTAAQDASSALDEAAWLEDEIERNYAKLDVADVQSRLYGLYVRARDAVLRGFEADSRHERLQEIAGELYWRAFRRLHASALVSAEQFHGSILDLLSTISERALPAVVHAGRRMITDEQHNAALREVNYDPWLSVVLAFCTSEQRAVPELASTTSKLISRVAFLKKVPLFSGMPSAELLPIASACDEASFAAGTTIFREGDLGTALFVVTEGAVDIVHGGAMLSGLNAGDVFGEIAVLGESTRTATAVAAKEVRCLLLEGERFREIVRKNGEIGLAVIRVLNERLRFATEREAALRAHA